MRIIDLKHDNKKKTVNYFYSLITDQNHVKQTTWPAYDMNVMANTDASAPVWRRNLKATLLLTETRTMTCVDMAALPMFEMTGRSCVV